VNIIHDSGLPAQRCALSDIDLLSQTSGLARDERATTIRLLHHLNEIARRKLYLELGHGSLHDYCTRGLAYSSSSACRRIRAARCIHEFPPVLPLLEAGELDLGTVSLIEPVLTGDNCEAILHRVRGRSYRTVRRVVSEYAAPITMAERIEPVRTFVTPSDIDGVLFDREIDRNMPCPSSRGTSGWVVSEQKMAVQFLASEALIEKYEEAKALLSHSHPDASFAEVLAVLLGEFLERTARPRESGGAKRSAPAPQVVNVRPSAPTGIVKTGSARGTSRPKFATTCTPATTECAPTSHPTAPDAGRDTACRSITFAPTPRAVATIPRT